VEYGPQIFERVVRLSEESGAHTARMQALRAEFERARDESSDRHRALCEKLDGLSEISQARHDDVAKLREMVGRCPQHHEVDVPIGRLQKTAEDSGAMRSARRSVLKALSAFFLALATLLGGWVASGPKI
jgi:uncharacterized coiled-coil DUF342 family protein